MQCDLLVTGSGIAGFSGSLEARSLGLSVVHAGGGGGGATRARLSRSAIAAALGRFPVGSLNPAMARCVASHVESAVDGYLSGLWSRMRGAGVRIESDEVELLSDTEIRVGDRRWKPRAVLIAVESEPHHPDRFDFDEASVTDPDSVLERIGGLRSAIVIGAEGDGCEIATILAASGCQVTLVDRRHRFLRAVDRDLLALFYGELRSAGVEVLLGETLERHSVRKERNATFLEVAFGSGREDRYEVAVVAAGRRAGTQRLGLEHAGIATDGRGRVLVNEFGATSQPWIYAAGEAVGFDGPVAAEWRHGSRVASFACGGKPRADEVETAELAWATVPTMASVGFTEEACERLEVPHGVGIARFASTLWGVGHCGRGGLLKLVTEPSGELLGAHAIGGDASDIVRVAASLIRARRTVQSLRASSEPGGIGELFARAAASGT